MVVKTQAAKLLEVLCDKVDGSVSLTAMVCFSFLDLFLSDDCQDVKQALEGNTYMSLKEFHHLEILKKSPEEVIEVSLLTLTIMSYNISKRPKDLLRLINAILHKYIDKLVKGPPIMQSRFSLLLSFYFDVIFLQEDDSFKKCIEFLITSLNVDKAQ